MVTTTTGDCNGSRRPGDNDKSDVVKWCARRDSNPHDVTHCHLKAARLPIPPRALKRPAAGLPPGGSDAPMEQIRGWGARAGRGLDGSLAPGVRGSICLTSTAIRFRSTSTTPL